MNLTDTTQLRRNALQVTSRSVATTTLTGTTGNDILNAPGSVTAEVVGLQGNDTITLALSGDAVNAGQGNDSITVGAVGNSSAVVSAGEGNDSIYFSGSVTNYNGNMLLNAGDDYLSNTSVQVIGGSIGGNQGADTISLDKGVLNAQIGGGSGNDKLVFTAGAFVNSTVFGGSNSDTIVFNPASTNLVTVQSGDGHDVIQATAGGSSTLVIAGGKGSDSIAVAQAGTINGGGLADTISFVAGGYAGGIVSGDGYATLSAGSGTGGAADGDDKISFTAGAKIAGATSVYGAGGDDSIYFAATAAAANVNVYGGAGADLIGGSAVKFIGGVYAIDGGAGHDTIKIGSLTKSGTILGGAGNDSIYIGGSANQSSIDGGSGNDSIRFLNAGQGAVSAVTAITIAGGSGSDSIYLGTMTKGSQSSVSVALSATLANLSVGSGDTVAFLSGSISSIANWLATDKIFVVSTLARFDTAATGTNSGTSGKGSVAVYDNGADLLIGIRADQSATWTFLNVLGGDSLIKTTKFGIVGLSSTNFGFDISSVNNKMNITFS
ncbi:MAG: hypothetical protein DCO99_07510 [Synechococcus sp. XM-24]|nr:MAG: hypothetical protein DCO99_07510 [Synechococcus sp. XM-24]